jgi:hypothetical protein
LELIATPIEGGNEMDTAVTAPKSRRPGTARIAAGVIVGMLGLLLIAVGITGIWVRTTSNDGSYVSSGTHRYASSGRAVVSDPMDVGVVPDWLVAKLRIRATSDKPLFVGVGRRTDVDGYLAGVARSTVEDVSFGPFAVEYSTQAGSAVPARPAAQTFWADSSSGTGEQTVSWKVRKGSWRVVVMNADGSPKVATDAKVGATLHGALVVVIVALALGLALAVGAFALVRRRA